MDCKFKAKTAWIIKSLEDNYTDLVYHKPYDYIGLSGYEVTYILYFEIDEN